MTANPSDVERRPASWGIANLVLVGLALALVATTSLLLTKGASADPGDSRSEMLSRQHVEVTKAARAQAKAFLTVDYKNMDPLIAEVLAGSTGTLEQEYESSRADLKARAQRAQATTVPKVVSIGISAVDDTSATVFVAANTTMRTKARKTPTVAPQRLKLTMVRKDGTWLTSNVQSVA